MAHSKQAKKRIRQNEKRRLSNKTVASKMRTLVKTVMTAAEAGDKETAEQNLSLAIKAVDKAQKASVLHKNTASRRKSQLMCAVNQAAGSQTAGA